MRSFLFGYLCNYFFSFKFAISELSSFLILSVSLFLASILGKAYSNWLLFLSGYFYFILVFQGNYFSPSTSQSFQPAFYVTHENFSGEMISLKGLRQSIQNEVIFLRNRGCKRGDIVELDLAKILKKKILSCPVNPGKDKLKKAKKAFVPEVSPSAGWVYAVFTGDKTYITPTFKSFMRDFGLLHMCAVSGFHLAVIVFFAMGLVYILKKICTLAQTLVGFNLLKTGIIDRVIGPIIIFSIISYWLYIIGFKSSAVRATVCYSSAFILSKISIMKVVFPTKVEKLFLNLFVFIMISPLEIFSFASLLSWVSYGIIVTNLGSQSSTGQDLSSSQKFLHGAAGIIKIQCLMFLMSAALAGEVSLFSFLGNILFLPVLTLFLKAILWVNIIFPEKVYLKLCELLDFLVFKVSDWSINLSENIPIILNSYGLSDSVTACIGGTFLIFFLKSINFLPNVYIRREKKG